MAGGSIEKLKEILGHSSVTITERHYVHLKPAHFTDRDRSTIAVDLLPGPDRVTALGHGSGTAPAAAGAARA